MLISVIFHHHLSLPQYLDCLYAQIQKLKKDRWQERHILRPYIAFDSVLCEALQHNLPPFTPPAHMPDCQYPMPRVIFRMFDYTDAPEVLCSTPSLRPVREYIERGTFGNGVAFLECSD